MKNLIKTGIVGLAIIVLASMWLGKGQQPTEETQTASEVVSVNTKLPLDQICMVNNAFMGKKQIEVPHAGKMYYGCCEMCVEKIQTQKAARYAIDPETGEEVDKAVAYITLDPAGSNNAVLYFESEQTSNQFFGK